MGQGMWGSPLGTCLGQVGVHGSGPVEVVMGKIWWKALGRGRTVDEPVLTQPRQEPFGPKPHQQRQRGWGEQPPAFPASPCTPGSRFSLFVCLLWF